MIGPVPTPEGKTLRQWQDEVTDFLRALSAQIERTTPVQLAYIMGDESAAVAGVLMYDPVTGHPVVSNGTEFKQIEYVP